MKTEIIHWFDFICPFCYIAQDRNAALRADGHTVDERPFLIHPEIGRGGAPSPLRVGGMYTNLEREAGAAGLTLRWSDRIPDSRPALGVAEYIRHHQQPVLLTFTTAVFDAYFGQAQDIEDLDVLRRCASVAGLAETVTTAALDRQEGERLLDEALASARRQGVTATPTWLLGDRLVSGLLPRDELVSLARVSAGYGRAEPGVTDGRP